MRILCAVDGSEFSQWGVEALEAIASREPDRVTLLHVVDMSALRAVRGKNPMAERRALAATEKASAQVLHLVERSARLALGQARTGPRTKISTVLAHGSLAQTIVKQARRLKTDLILIGSRGLSDIRGFLLGSVSRHVVSIAPCPVLVVKRPTPKLHHVVLAVDDSRHSRAAATFLRRKFLPESTSLTVFSAIEPVLTELASKLLPPEQVEKLLAPGRDRVLKLVATMREQFLKEGYSVTTDVRSGHPTDTIFNFSAVSHADLLVLGSRGLTGSDRARLGSVSEAVLKYAPCSVLIVRGPRA